MLQLLSARQYGLDPPWLLPRVYGSHRFSQLELSKEKELARAHTTAVNSMDLDCDGRYLISGGGDVAGSVVVHDTSRRRGEAGTHTCPVTDRTFGSYSDETSHAVSVVQWFPHDTGIFTTSSGDQYLKIWDTNELMKSSSSRSLSTLTPCRPRPATPSRQSGEENVR
jgi:DNA excision repair protein ERCC-8